MQLAYMHHLVTYLCSCECALNVTYSISNRLTAMSRMYVSHMSPHAGDTTVCRCLSCDNDLRAQQNALPPKPPGKSGLFALLDRASGQEPSGLPPLAPQSATPTDFGNAPEC